ncbi:hypothetical protein PanWU01x14_094210 [Parasponia andersonii]|uniref:Uncharacterized protein n=1 Tax=Parasponia andersonii TaxID=3476 RepID=A0A2P5D5N0_PARAD|nr:hypothetical protein PanWU01x14_094210 [Parasponia andersonii]
MDSDEVRHEPRHHHPCQRQAYIRLIHHLGGAILPCNPFHGRLDHQQHENHEAHARHQNPDRHQGALSAAAISVSGEGDGEGQENPSGNVVEGRSGHGGLPNSGGEELELSEDASEDREGSDGEGDPHEDEELTIPYLVGSLDSLPEDKSDTDATDKREGNTGEGYAKGSPPAAADGAEVEL